MPADVIAGVDGCPGGWYLVQARLEGGAVEGRVCRSFAELLQTLPPSALIAVDMPIGLLDAGARACDVQARALLGRRGSSVFPAPLRGVLGAATHVEASARARALDGRGMSIQAYNILRKVEEVDAALCADARAAARTFEVHPEVSFAQLNGGPALLQGKKSADGHAQRRALLEVQFPGQLDPLLGAHPRRQVQADDVLDALACLWSARRLARGQALCLPAQPPRDACGLRMAIQA